MLSLVPRGPVPRGFTVFVHVPPVPYRGARRDHPPGVTPPEHRTLTTTQLQYDTTLPIWEQSRMRLNRASQEKFSHVDKWQLFMAAATQRSAEDTEAS